MNHPIPSREYAWVGGIGSMIQLDDSHPGDAIRARRMLDLDEAIQHDGDAGLCEGFSPADANNITLDSTPPTGRYRV